ncbi:adenine deaminase [Alkaliphilus hydrothermalis]|uniref:Adenine deaminase n=1 Tax=Alkaliphilus hydrothermalis TaxID=1482730 RepID=A0ABS2NSS0_9FIRM|nr:adenine deaminase [Alkaliphilus hydrothermalis]MBM7615956.1 adenine deaminase [Alkaliphilus hydrothermalis]
MEEIKRRIDIAAGRIKPQLVLKGGKVINVFSGEVYEGDVAIDNGKIVAIGEYEGEKEVNVIGKIVAPGLIDGHLHIESAMVTPPQFARAIVPHGTTTIIADPHEIANVCGQEGIKYILEARKGLPLNIYVMLPSCVPSTSFESSGAVLTAVELGEMIGEDGVLGLGEMMNYPGVIHKEEDVIAKLEMAKGKIVDGHGPELVDKDLAAYVTAGIRTEHECSTVEEMQSRLRAGMYILIREGSAARNLKELVKGVKKENVRRCLFCTDDKHPEDLLRDGHIDHNIRLAIGEGMDPIMAIQMATINAAECYGLKNLGAIAPGYDADLIVVDGLESFNVEKVFKKGELVAEDSKPLFDVVKSDYSRVVDTVRIKPVSVEDLRIPLDSDIVNVIRLLPHSLLTDAVVRRVLKKDGCFQFHPSLDILKMAVVERHNATGNIGLGLVEDFQLKGGAIASTIAHDSHNIIVIGDNDGDMLTAIKEVSNHQGGIAIVSKGKVLESLPLPIAGLISFENMEVVNQQLNRMLRIAYEELGVNQNIDPFMTLSFLALPVIPEIKLTDQGLFDVSQFKFKSLEV